jgi:CheY-like chemotaxis protein
MVDSPSTDAEPAQPATVRVLAVDDSTPNLMIIASFLRHAQVGVRTVDTGADALAAYQAFAPHLVLMDLSMPEVDGFEAAASIRRHEAASGLVRVPIIALTAFEIDGELCARIALSMDGHLSKPVRKQDVLRLLAQWTATDPLKSA